MRHPYENAPARAFWSRSVAADWDPATTVTGAPLIRSGDKVVSAGSCFAANMVPHLETAGFSYVRTERRHPRFIGVAPESFSYGKFSAGYGNIYTARQLVQLVERCLCRFSPAEDRWPSDGAIVDPFRPGLRYGARSIREFDVLTRQHLDRTLDAFSQADVFIFTLGLTEAWMSKLDGAVFPACPGTVAGTFDPDRHVFHQFGVFEVVQDLERFITLLEEIAPRARTILTVSPVPLVATATGDHVLCATTYSKSVLRAAAGDVANRHASVSYFPAYELVTGPQAPFESFEPNRRDPSSLAIDAVMQAFLANCEAPPGEAAAASSPAALRSSAADLSRAMSEAECEEVMADRHPARSAPPSSVGHP